MTGNSCCSSSSDEDCGGEGCLLLWEGALDFVLVAAVSAESSAPNAGSKNESMSRSARASIIGVNSSICALVGSFPNALVVAVWIAVSTYLALVSPSSRPRTCSINVTSNFALFSGFPTFAVAPSAHITAEFNALNAKPPRPSVKYFSTMMEVCELS